MTRNYQDDIDEQVDQPHAGAYDDDQRTDIPNAEDPGEFNGKGKATNGHGSGPAEPLPFLNIAAMGNTEAPLRDWAVPGRIPSRQVTLFSGEGEIGKSLLEMQRACAHVLGRDWVGTLPEPGPAIVFNAEDEADELHRRLARIAVHYQTTFAELANGGLHVLSFAGKDAVLAHADKSGLVKPTPLLARLRTAVLDIKPKSVSLDTSADVFVGNESDRSQVRQFIGLLRGLAIEGNTAISLCSHPSLTGINSDTGLSGSTAWHNSVRARAYFKAAATADGEMPDPDLRELVFLKNNYGPKAERILLRWRDGVFIVEPKTGSLEKMAADAKVEELFLKLLDRFNGQGRNVSEKSGTAYAPAIFANEPEAKAVKISKAALADAMGRLFTANRIHLEQYGFPSRGTFKLVSGAKP
jgi:RecA-family ATPase